MHCLHKQSELEMGEKGNSSPGFCYGPKQTNKKKEARLLQEVARFGEQGHNLSDRDMFRLGGGPNAAFGIILVK